jgi:hypothetical protein
MAAALWAEEIDTIATSNITIAALMDLKRHIARARKCRRMTSRENFSRAQFLQELSQRPNGGGKSAPIPQVGRD